MARPVQCARLWQKQPAAFFLLDAVQVTEGSDIRQLAECCDPLGVPVKLIVVDTLARCFVGHDENSAQAMGQFVAGIDRLKLATGAAVVVVHHSGKTKDSKPADVERGSSALRAAAEVMVSVTMDKDKLITLKNDKQKDDEEFQPMKLRLEQVQLGSGPKQTTSCVLRREEHIPARTQTLPTHLRVTLQALASCPNGEANVNEWRARTTSPERTIHTHRNDLVQRGLVEPRPLKGRYAITAKGRVALGGTAATETKLQIASGSSLPIATAAMPPPR